MKICPRCGKTYPDGERFCETDGTALVTSAGAASPSAMPAGDAETGGVCPECGGRTEAGETICNYCGTRLIPDAAAAASPSAGTVYTGQAGYPGQAGQGRTVNPEDYVPAHDRDAGFGGRSRLPAAGRL